METCTLTCFARSWTGLYMVEFLMLEVFLKRPLCFTLRELFGFFIICNTSPSFAGFGDGQNTGGVRILRCVWDVFITSIPKYIGK